MGTKRARPARGDASRARRQRPPVDDPVVIGAIGKPVGLGGAVRVFLHNPSSEQLERDEPLELELASGMVRPVKVAELRYGGGGAVVRFEGVESRESADLLRGGAIRVPRASLPAPAEGEFYVWDLERCQVTLAGEPFGVVTEVLPYPTCEVLVIGRPDGTTVEVPLHEDFVREVRVAQSTIDLRTIEGLV